MLSQNKFEPSKYCNLLRELVVRDIKRKYRRSVLGILWSMLNPILIMLIMSVVFSHLFRFEIHNFLVYLITGQVIFNFYSEATSFSMGAIIDNGGLLKKVYVPKYLFVISRVLSSLVNLAFTMPAVLVIVLITDNDISWRFLLFVIPIILLFLFCMGVGLFLSAASVFFRDIFHLYGVVLTAFSYATPIFYPITIIPEKWRYLLHFNPLTYYMDAFRAIIYYDKIPQYTDLGMCALLAFMAIVIGGYFFKKKQSSFILYI